MQRHTERLSFKQLAALPIRALVAYAKDFGVDVNAYRDGVGHLDARALALTCSEFQRCACRSRSEVAAKADPEPNMLMDPEGWKEWKVLRDKPRRVQEEAAALDKPTAAAARRVAQQDAQAGVSEDLLNQMNADNALVTMANELRTRVVSHWTGITQLERDRLQTSIRDLLRFMEEHHAH